MVLLLGLALSSVDGPAVVEWFRMSILRWLVTLFPWLSSSSRATWACLHGHFRVPRIEREDKPLETFFMLPHICYYPIGQNKSHGKLRIRSGEDSLVRWIQEEESKSGSINAMIYHSEEKELGESHSFYRRCKWKVF